jgi:hypothetical protein
LTKTEPDSVYGILATLDLFLNKITVRIKAPRENEKPPQVSKTFED